MSNQDSNTDEKEIKSAIMDELEDAVDEYLASFKAQSSDGTSLPTMDQIEDIVSELRSKTRDIYLRMVSESITRFNESELIDSKKGSTKKEG